MTDELNLKISSSSTKHQSQREQKRSRILFVNRSYWPDAEATGQLLSQLAEGLSEQHNKQYEVTVLVGQPNANPNEEPYRKFGSQVHNGVRVFRIPHTWFSKRSGIGRMINLVSFVISAVFFGMFLRKQDVVIYETDPFLLPLAAPFFRLRHRCKQVFYLQDIYPDVAVALGKAKEGTMISFLRDILFRQYRKSDRVIVLSRDMKRLCQKHGVQKEKLATLPNWCDVQNVYPIKENNAFRKQHQLEEMFLMMHSGNMGLSQNLEQILDVAEQLQNDVLGDEASRYKDVRILLVGGGAKEESLKSEVQRRQLSNVLFFPYQPWDELAASLSAADLQLISVDERALQCLMPSKLYGILASGTPVLAIAPEESELAEVITKNNVGYVVPQVVSQAVLQDGTNAIIGVIDQLKDNPILKKQLGDNARQLAESEYDFRHILERFHQMINTVLGRQSVEGDTL